MKWKEMLSAARDFVRRNAYGVTLGLSLAVIVGTGVYVKWPAKSPETPPDAHVAVEEEHVEHLAQAQRTTVVPTDPTASPLSMVYAISQPACVWPLKGSVTREYSGHALVYQPTLARYEVHTGADLAGEAGDTVVSPMSGTVAAIYADGLWGEGITITHPDGLESTIFGVQVNASLKPGLAVRAGEAIGKLAASIDYEAKDGTHLHWTLRRDTKTIDPRTAIR